MNFSKRQGFVAKLTKSTNLRLFLGSLVLGFVLSGGCATELTGVFSNGPVVVFPHAGLQPSEPVANAFNANHLGLVFYEGSDPIKLPEGSVVEIKDSIVADEPAYTFSQENMLDAFENSSCAPAQADLDHRPVYFFCAGALSLKQSSAVFLRLPNGIVRSTSLLRVEWQSHDADTAIVGLHF